MPEMEKLEREDGTVAVLVSRGFGAGFVTCGAPIEAAFDPALVRYILDDDLEGAVQFVESKYPDVYTGGVEDLEVEWLPKGTSFKFKEHDGSESLLIRDSEEWYVA